MRKSIRRLALLGAAAAAPVAGSPALAQEPAPTIAPAIAPVPASIPITSDVAAAYDTYHLKPIWFRPSAGDTAVAQLIAILRRASFDGFAEGPQLASEVQAIAAHAASDPAAKPKAEQMLSTAWVRYVQALRRPTDGMFYAFQILKPQGTRAEDILLTTAAAPSLASYLAATSDLNPVYEQLRDGAWAEAQANGNLAPDPRLLANLDRARSIPAQGKFLLVDAGDQRLTMFENAQAVDSMKIIVGTNQLPTPLISSIMYYVTYNPYWHAPDHLVRKTIAPTVLRQGMKYLKSHGYHVIDQWSSDAKEVDPTTVDWKGAAMGNVHLLIRQDPGPLNSMGSLKFPFPNEQDIYLHDTPGKELFGKDVRNLSNGCVRLEDARRLARWLLGHDPIAPGSDPEMAVQLPKGVPIVLTYLTAQVVDGKLTYRDDFYGWDTTGAPRLAANSQ